MAAEGWHYQLNGQVKGPYSEDQFRALCEARSIHGGTMIWRPGMADWQPLGQVDSPFRALLGQHQVMPAYAPQMAHPGAGVVAHGPAQDVTNASLWSLYWGALTQRYVGFSGRASRKEYWSYILFFYLFLIGLLIVAFLIDLGIDQNLRNGPVVTLIVGGLYFLAHLLPGLALMVRRLHDLGMSGWFVLLGFIPYIGGIVILVFALIPGQVQDNEHGPAPR